MLKKSRFASQIVEWYQQNKRPLPWRETTDPYTIWLSEIILQQTRVVQGLPYFRQLITRFPDVFTLASAKEKEVLRLWQGLGYYTRARNLHRCAKTIVKDHKGKFPASFEALKKLPGIGAYTAAAIASFSFQEPVPVVDGNVFRVLARVFAIDKDISQQATKEFFFQLASQIITHASPDVFNQAMMEFGATQCMPKNPNCSECIFTKTCEANRLGLQQMLPVKSKKTKVRHRYFYYLVFVKEGKIMMKKRTGKDIWTGLYDFYLVETDRKQQLQKVMKETESILELKDIHWQKVSKIYRHVLTHQIILARFVPVMINSKSNFKKPELSLRLYSAKAVQALPKPVLISRYLAEAGLLA